MPQTPELQSYLQYTQTIASSLSHAWDLASLLIKPVQRLLKYPLLLGAIIDETPDTHPDKENLRQARSRIEEVARNVNEGRRRAEVIKDVLSGSKNKKVPPVGVTVAAGVNISKMKSLRHGGVTAATMKVDSSGNVTLGEDGSHAPSHEAAMVEALHEELKRIEIFAKKFAKDVVDYSKMMSNLMHALRNWALSFGRVIGLSEEQGSEAFDAFLQVVEGTLMPLAVELEGVINERLLKDMAHLLKTMTQPLKLLASMNDQEPFHYHLLTMLVSAKNRPPPSLLAASTNYLALRGQLAAELPDYIRILNRGILGIVWRLAGIQRKFWRDVRDRWGELWEMLRVEGEWNAGMEETIGVWRHRWKDVDEIVNFLTICQPIPASTTKSSRRGSIEHYQSPAPSFQNFNPLSPPMSSMSSKLEKRSSQKKHPNGSSSTVQTVFSALEPSYSPKHQHKSSSSTSSQFPGPSLDSSPYPAHLHVLNGNPGSGSSIYSAASSYFAPNAVYATSAGMVVSNPLPLQSKSAIKGNGSSKDSHRRGSSQDATPRRRDSLNRSSTSSSAALQRRRTAPTEEMDQFQGVTYDALGYAHGQLGSASPQPQAQSTRHYASSSSSSQQHHRGGIPRTKSMPLSGHLGMTSIDPTASPKVQQKQHRDRKAVRDLDHLPLVPGGGYVVDGDQVYYHGPQEESYYQDAPEWTDALVKLDDEERAREEKAKSRKEKERAEKERGRKRESIAGGVSGRSDRVQPEGTGRSKPKDQDRDRERERDRDRQAPPNGRKRSGSVKSVTSFFGNTRDGSPQDAPPVPASNSSHRDSWASKPAKYVCVVIHPCKPPAQVSYYSFPFFTLLEGDYYEVLQEAGHPSIHPKLPLYVDDGEDCLLLCRDDRGMVGWALASFLEPVTFDQ